MHEGYAQQAIAQMPQIICPEPFGSTAIVELSEDGIDAIANPAQYRTPTMRRMRTGFAKRSQDQLAHIVQGHLQTGEPVAAVVSQQPTCSGHQVPDDFALVVVSRSQVHIHNDSWPAHPQVQPKAVERLATGTIFTKAGRVVKTIAAIGASILVHRDRHTIHDGDDRIIEQQSLTDQTAHTPFYRPQVGHLAYKLTAVQMSRHRQKVCVMVAKVVEHFLILTQTQVGSYDFHRVHLAISELGLRASFPQAFAFCRNWKELSNLP